MAARCWAAWLALVWVAAAASDELSCDAVDCSNHGFCDAGACTCYPGWTGEDCAERAECPAACNLKGPRHAA